MVKRFIIKEWENKGLFSIYLLKRRLCLWAVETSITTSTAPFAMSTLLAFQRSSLFFFLTTLNCSIKGWVILWVAALISLTLLIACLTGLNLWKLLFGSCSNLSLSCNLFSLNFCVELTVNGSKDWKNSIIWIEIVEVLCLVQIFVKEELKLEDASLVDASRQFGHGEVVVLEEALGTTIADVFFVKLSALLLLE